MEGVSTRRVDDLVKALGCEGISKSQVSRICQELDVVVDGFLGQSGRAGPGDQDKPVRQNVYLEALAILPDLQIHYGYHVAREQRCPRCGATRQTYEEKMTDVNIAVELLGDVQDDAFDTAIIISGDGDLASPVRAVGERYLHDLSFYPENPRIHSLIQRPGAAPSQDEIFNRLRGLDHVKQLIQSIRANGGLTDPVLVRDGDLVVLEGNSRLAAYRELARNDAITWGKAKVRLLPSDISEELVFALLGEYHIIGRKDWAPYEQAGYLYRRNVTHGVSAQSMASEMGLPVRTVNHLINTYKFMVEHTETSVTRWSYYDEYLKSNIVRKARREKPELDDIVVGKIKRREIPAAVDVRNKLVKLLNAAKVGSEPTKILVSGDKTFDRAFESAQDRGVDNMWLRRFKRFRGELQVTAFLGDLDRMSLEQQDKCLYEVGKIQQSIERITRQRVG